MDKDIIIEFITTVFFILLIIFFIWLFVLNNYFGTFVKMLKIIAPLGLFILVALMKPLAKLYKKRNSSREINDEIILYLSYADRIKADLILFIIPTLIYLIPFIFNGINTKINTIQSITVFIIIYFWQKNLFNKKR